MNICKRSLILALFVSMPVLLFSQTKEPESKERGTMIGAKTLTYDSILSFKRLATGLFNVYEKDQRYFFEISSALLDAPLLIVNRIARGAAMMKDTKAGLGYAGDKVNEKIISFTVGQRNQLYMTNLFYDQVSVDSSIDGLSRSFIRSNMPPLTAAFDILARSPNGTSVVIELTNYLQTDNETFYFQPAVKELNFGLGALQSDRSFVKDIRSFPTNTEIKTVRTYAAPRGQALGGLAFQTFELNSSIVLLPQKPMKSRAHDSRVGYFPVTYQDYDANPQSVKKTRLINKWRLEPRQGDLDRYVKGELVEPEKPIVFYIDPATPRKWVPYLIKGVEAWNGAFEKAGFKNAVRALEAPASDTGWSLEDARHNAIVYKPSPIENASGPVIMDPRTGEILEAHVSWYHNVLKLLHDWYFVQTGAVDPRALQAIYPDTLMGRLITYVCSHEIGHTLGLMHNWRASSMVPVDSLRSRSWVKKYGTCPSIMDYARFNYVAQPEDSIAPDDLIPRIGPYDEWAISWGYRNFYQKDAAEEQMLLDNWIVQEVEHNAYLNFGSEFASSDPRNQAEDLGDDAVKASTLGIANLKRIKRNLVVTARTVDDDYSYLAEMYKNIVAQYLVYLNHVADRLGGAMFNARKTRQEGAVWSFVDKVEQLRAISFLDTALFNNSEWLIDGDIFALTQKGTVYDVLFVQKDVLKKILSPDVLGNIFWYGASGKQQFGVDVYLRELTNRIFKEAKLKKNTSMLRRILQKNYVEQLIAAALPYKGNDYGAFSFYSANIVTDVSSSVKGEINHVLTLLKSYRASVIDPVSKSHAEDLLERLTDLDKK